MTTPQTADGKQESKLVTTKSCLKMAGNLASFFAVIMVSMGLLPYTATLGMPIIMSVIDGRALSSITPHIYLDVIHNHQLLLAVWYLLSLYVLIGPSLVRDALPNWLLQRFAAMSSSSKRWLSISVKMGWTVLRLVVLISSVVGIPVWLAMHAKKGSGLGLTADGLRLGTPTQADYILRVTPSAPEFKFTVLWATVFTLIIGALIYEHWTGHWKRRLEASFGSAEDKIRIVGPEASS